MKLWTRAAEAAAQTPPSRNRYVDLLRAVSIFLVIGGHWTAAAPHLDAQGELVATHVLAVAPWTHWLTWGVQVMPIFFLVGGYSNGISWRAACGRETTYAAWLEGRLARLVGPVLPLLAAWAAIGVAARLGGVGERMLGVGSQMALIPLWFLAVYVVVVLLTPVSHALWERLGLASVALLVALAVAVDAATLSGAVAPGFGWINYLFVWSAVHQLGYAWRDGKLTGAARTLGMAAVGLVALLLLVELGPYPVSMVGVPGEGLSNTTPPKVPLLALAFLQTGLLLALEPAGRRWLQRAAPWTATVLINGMIMTIFLWHMTAMVLAIGLLVVLGGFGLGLEPNTDVWWAARPAWLAGLVLVLVVLATAAARFENPRRRSGDPPPAWRLVGGAVLVCFGLALVAYFGIAGDGWLGLRLAALVPPFAGAALARRW
jgi:peptidoglycan/LPS O-acetylase OafA/YrhL